VGKRPRSSCLLLQGEVPGKKGKIQVLEFLLVSNLFSINTAELMAKCKARSPHTSVSSCFRHYKQQGKRTLSTPLKATPVYQFLSSGGSPLCKVQMPAELDRTQQRYDLPWRVASCRIPPEKILTEIKSKQPLVLTNRVKESLPLDTVHCKQTSNHGTGPFFLV